MVDSYLEHLRVMRECGCDFKPKHHLALHLLIRQQFLGNVKLQATWMDEGLNRRAKEVAASCHGLAWYRRFLTRVDWVMHRET
jgi:hypothetical protein